MKPQLTLPAAKLLLIVWSVLITLLSPVSAQADSYDTFVGFIEDVEDKSQGAFKLENTPLEISTEELREYKTIVNCLQDADNDVAVAICVDMFNETSAGQKITAEAGIPSYVDNIIDAYIMYRTHDWWGLAKELGGIAVCIVLHVATGVDACGLIQALVDAANALWDAANAVWDWAKDIGGAAWDAVSGAYCDIVGWGCDDEPDTPAFVVVYNLAFHPRVKEGITAREEVDGNAYYNLVESIKKDALHKPDPIFPGASATVASWFAGSFYPQSVDQASQVYQNNVDVQWSNDILNRVVPERRQQMDAYGNPLNYLVLANLMLQDYEKSPAAWNARRAIEQRCTDQFKNNFGYVHIDRWLYASISDPNIQKLKSDVPSNGKLCSQFFDINRNEFGQRARDYIVSKEICRDAGAELACSTVDDYKRCAQLLTPFGTQEHCKMTYQAAAAVKAEIIEAFKQKGSRFYGSQGGQMQGIQLQGTAAKSISTASLNVQNLDMILTQPLEFVCFRPSHAFYFDRFYEKYANLPQQLLKKVLKVDPPYTTLVQAVKNAVDKINTTPAYMGMVVGVADPGRDPLVVATGTMNDVDTLKAANEDFGFEAPSTQPGFAFASYTAFPDAIDGQDTPVIFHDLATKIKDSLKKDRLKVNPNVIDGKIDPITKPGFNQNIKQSVTTPQSVQVFKQQGIKNAALPQTAPTQPMSGTLPPGQQPKSAPTPFAKVDTSVKGSMKAEAVRIEGGKNLKIAGKTAYWGRSMTLNAKDALSQADGTCRFNLEYTLQNRGKANSGMFYSRWENRSLKGRTNERRMSSLTAGGAQKVTETIDLVPGKNSVVLTLNSRGKSGEQQRYELTINLSGNCALRSNMATPQRSVITPEPTSKSIERSTTVKPAETPQKDERTVKNPVFAPVR